MCVRFTSFILQSALIQKLSAQTPKSFNQHEIVEKAKNNLGINPSIKPRDTLSSWHCVRTRVLSARFLKCVRPL